MKKFYFLAALVAGTALTSCTSEDDLALSPPEVNVEDAYAPIVFSSLKNNITRAGHDITGAAAADSLGRKFVVFGYKGSATATIVEGSTVFDNYLVEYTENTANTTESNSSNWEYVGKTPIKHATDNGITKQTIKYWDYSQAQYDFIAWSTGKKDAIYSGTPAAGQVLVSEITPQAVDANDPTKGLGAAYTFEGKAADLSDCYIADLVTVLKTGTEGVNTVVGYNQPVTLRFRQLGTKVRIGIYETIPGYSVRDVKFYSAADNALLNEDDATNGTTNKLKNDSAKIFTTAENEIYTEGTYTVYFPTVDKKDSVDNNQAHITFAAKKDANNQDIAQSTIINWGSLKYTIRESGESSTDSIYLGRSSNTASFAGNPATNYYVVYLPNQNGTNLNLRVNYTLESIDGSKEKIYVKGATAQVPLIYTQWKPGYAYTYLFKISDKTNGFTGPYDPTKPDDLTVNSTPAGLYPITFDAIVVNAEDDKMQETITTVSAPSITTYQKGSNVVNQNEYLAATGPIFVTVNDGEKESTPDLANGKVVTLTTSGDGQAALYKLPDGKTYTEADVISALQTQDDDAEANTIKGRSGLVLTEAAFELVDSIKYGVDGNAIDLKNIPNGNTTYSANALQFTATAGTYAFVYTKKASTATTPKYQAKTFADGADVNGYYRYNLVAAVTPVDDSHTGDVEKGVTYFNNDDASADAITAFLGQGVGNLYIQEGNAAPYTYTIASGYAQTGTTYYYTLDGGQNYLPATKIAYADFGTTTLYVYDKTANNNAGAYVASQDQAPVDGTAYYVLNSTTNEYEYCVIYPQRTDNLYVIDKTEANITKCVSPGLTAVKGMTYFDMYTQNNGVYYTKVIKVQ